MDIHKYSLFQFSVLTPNFIFLIKWYILDKQVDESKYVV